MSTDQIDIGGAALRLGTITVAPEEHPEDRSQRHKIEGRQAFLADIKDLITFVVILCALGAIGGFAAYRGLFSPASDPATEHWCQSVLTAVVTGGISFVLGRSSKGK